VLRARNNGMSAARIGETARDLGLGLIVDPVMNWYPDSAVSPSRFAGVGAEDALRMCEDLGSASFSAIATATSDVPMDALPEYFGRLCDRAADFGADVHLEFIPFTIVRTLKQAWTIVGAADRPNGGLVFDTWHFFRGEPDFAQLRNVPGERIFQVQIDDATRVPSGELRHETQRRLLPGDGELDLTAVIDVLHRSGGLRWVGPEVINPELAAMAPTDAARVALARSRAVLEQAASRPRH
jgi:sugar phosphate isomerase/epimerase